MKVVPPAVAGRWRWVTTPPTSTLAPGGTAASPSAETAPSPSSRSGGNCAGWLSPDSPVAHRSAAPSSTGLIPGSRGASAPTAVPGSRSALAWATAPAAHSAAPRPPPPPHPPRPDPPRGAQPLPLPLPHPGPPHQIGHRVIRPPRRHPLRQLLPQRPHIPDPHPHHQHTHLPAPPPPHPPRPPALLPFQGRGGRGAVDVGTADGHTVAAGVGDQGVGRPEAHRLGVQQGGQERGRVVELQPGTGVDQVGERHRGALGEAEGGEGGQVVVDPV